MYNIKIFVSNRIDINSHQITNELFYPVRCGAVFDRINCMNIPGDNTGDNISEKRMTFCEFTVQYWAWKNAEADYYGLCHYRRYLSFSERRFKTNHLNMIHNAVLTWESAKRYGLCDSKKMRCLISDYDIITSEACDIREIPGMQNKTADVLSWWKSHNDYLENSTIDMMLKLIDDMYPQYSESAHEYLASPYHRGYNCYVMKKEWFYRMCKFQFPIMEAIEKQLDTSGYSQTMSRSPAFVGEILYGIFMYHAIVKEKCSYKELQLTFFSKTDKANTKAEKIGNNLWQHTDKLLRKIFDPLFPAGSARREKIKNMFFSITKVKARGEANINEER